MLLTLITLITLWAILKWKHVSVSGALVSFLITVICYAGIFGLIITTFAQSMKRHTH